MNTETERTTLGLSGESTLVASGLKKNYGDFAAVRGVDFRVSGGECFGFLGPNGAGKTTTMKMIYGAVIPTGGELTVAGLDVYHHEREIKRRIGVVPQENNLDDELKVRENLLIYGRYYDLPRKVVLQRTDELLDFMQLSDKAEATVEQLSGGMKRRLLIARALINDPEIVILDEPTTGLDPQARLLVWDRLRKLAAEGKTLILTTHYMEEAARLCDRLAIMERGLIIAEGTPKALVEEHVSPQVIELRTDRRSLERLLPIVEAASDAVERTGEDRLLAYTEDVEALLEDVRSSGVEIENTAYRHTGLEDVFLRLTGRRLVE
ncbi:MAG TPA: ABC transporter ATP-binding protein [Rubrobacter sp.]|nr:ABC transporter ATP-binding protein [Rubrobacter sp.]